MEGLKLGMQREGSDKGKRLLVSTPFSQDSPSEHGPVVSRS